MAANAFYLTMSFYYFFVFLALALAVPLVFGRCRSEPGRARDGGRAAAVVGAPPSRRLSPCASAS